MEVPWEVWGEGGSAVGCGQQRGPGWEVGPSSPKIRVADHPQGRSHILLRFLKRQPRHRSPHKEEWVRLLHAQRYQHQRPHQLVLLQGQQSQTDWSHPVQRLQYRQTEEFIWPGYDPIYLRKYQRRGKLGTWGVEAELVFWCAVCGEVVQIWH